MIVILILLLVLCLIYLVVGIKREGLMGFFIEIEEEEGK